MRYGRPIEEYIEHFSPIVAAGLCTGATGNKSPQEIADKAYEICLRLGKKIGMKTEAELEAAEKLRLEQSNCAHDMKGGRLSDDPKKCIKCGKVE